MTCKQLPLKLVKIAQRSINSKKKLKQIKLNKLIWFFYLIQFKKKIAKLGYVIYFFYLNQTVGTKFFLKKKLRLYIFFYPNQTV